MRVFVYYNLHKKCLSIKALEGASKGRVILHADAVCLNQVTFKVSQAGRNRVLRDQVKNVHAGLVGELSEFIPFKGLTPEAHAVWQQNADLILTNGISVTYNPYLFSSFVNKNRTSEVVDFSPRCIIINKLIFSENANKL